MTETIYGNADVARLLFVTYAAIGNYLARYDDTPAPAYQTVSGQRFWTLDGMREWQTWHATLRQVGRHGETRQRAQEAIDKLRGEL